ncbi:cellulose binding domain-containing protein [Estrella lausannensis]|uniref:Glycoside hydrolase n=1 Tax=Estrella lausannensis TaxID=483423 RepID=A0A0H5DPG7_9BACT|nr:cellulose binding domain-containing protein [Estrella lausannensis]CRX38456.1 Glycoside hydrolase [Estrella lausannensis]
MGKLLLLFFCFAGLLFESKAAAADVPLNAEYRVDTMWATAYQVTVKLTNPTNQQVQSWQAGFFLPQQNVLSAHTSGGVFTTSGQEVSVTNASSNGTIAAFGSVTFNAIINMPQSGKTSIENLVATGYSTASPPQGEGLAAPALYPISSSSATDYTVTWSAVTGSSTYFLEMDSTINFTNPIVTPVSSANTVNFTDQPPGTYFYRVAAANSSGRSPYSNIESITIAATGSPVALSAVYKVDTVWATAFQATVTLTNRTTVPVKGWTATFSLPSGFSLSSHVNSGIFSASGQNITVKNLASNETIQPNAGVSFGMIITMPKGAKPRIDNLQASGNGNSTVPLPVPSAPIITLIASSQSSYSVSWESVVNASSYTLEEDTVGDFLHPRVVAQGNILSELFTNIASGTYYYRALASNATGNSPYSNVVSITVTNDNPIPPRDAIEYSVWYIDWTSWFNGPPFVIPQDVNMINIFVGELRYGQDGKPTMGGFGTFTESQIKSFTQYLAAQNPSIQAKVSIGGAGGMYDRTWDILTPANIKAFAQGMVDFCHNLGLAGVDFDYEAFVSAEQEALVGALIKEFKLLDPSLQTSLCSNAGFGPNYPWQQAVKNVLDAAMISPGNCAVDRFYIMSYYNSMSEEIGWITGSDGNGGWANWLITNYGFNRARISVGIDDFDAHAYDPDAFRSWAISQGFSVAHWAFDPARPKSRIQCPCTP